MHDTKQLGDLRPVFDANRIVTAGNSSGINDGAAAVMARQPCVAVVVRVWR